MGSRTRVGAVWRWNGTLAYFLGLQLFAVPVAAPGQAILPDGRTQTTVSTSGRVTDVRTGTVRGGNAFNSFHRFNVNAGTVANLHLPNGSENLINIVRDQRTDVHGILNAIRDGRIGGNVWFANPHGFLVGESGVVNVGSLSLSTPTQAFVDGFFTAPGDPNDAAVAALLAGTAPRNGTGLISIRGQVNAIDGVSLSAGTISVAGSVYSGARFVGTAPDFSDVVNANGLTQATHVVERDGRIEIVADGDVTVSGTLATPGSAGVKGGDIAIRAGGSVQLEDGANIVARGLGAGSDGGTIYIWADHDASFLAGATIDARAGASGDGGAIELSAAKTVNLSGGQFRAAASDGRNGSVLIDPEGIFITTVEGSDSFRITDGADLTLSAFAEITVDDGVIVSTRNVANPATDDHETAASTGHSGNVTFSAPTITLGAGSKILTFADGGFNAGSVSFDASLVGEISVGQNAQIRSSSNTGAGGSVTFKALDITTGAGSQIHAGAAVTFEAGADISIGANSLVRTSRGGGASGNLSFTAPEITIGAGAEISTAATGSRNAGTLTLDASGNELFGQTLTIGQNAKLLATAVDGDAGAITLKAGTITAETGSQIHADATGSGDAADVTIQAERTPAINFMGYREGTASVVLTGTSVRGADVEVSATTNLANEWTNDGQQPVDGVIQTTTNLAEVASRMLLALVGIDIVHSQAIGTAIVTIGAGSAIHATGDVTLTATNNTSTAVLDAPSLPGGVNSPLGLGAMYMRNQSNATVEVKTGASITAENLTVRAHNEATLEGSVESSADHRFGVSLAAGVTYADVNARARIESGATITVSEDVKVVATNRGTYSNESAAMAGQDAGGQGMAAVVVAFSEHKSSTEAEIAANIAGANKVEVLSINEVLQDTTVAESKVGQTLTDAVVNGVSRKALGVTEDGQDSLIALIFGDTSALMSEKVKPKNSPFRLGGAIAFSDSTATATAKIADNASISATEHVVTAARVVSEDSGTQAHAAAVSNSNRGQTTGDTASVSMSAGVVVAKYKHTADALVGKNATLSASKIGIASHVSLPGKSLDEFNRWDGWDNIKGNLETVVSAIDPFTYFNGGASAKSSATNVGLSGSVNIQTYTNDARAIVDQGASLLLTGAESGAWETTFQVKAAEDSDPADDQSFSFDAAAHVRADQDATLRWLAGKPSLAASGPKALGGSYNQVKLEGDTLALVREGAVIRGAASPTALAEDAQVTAHANDSLLTVAAVAGSGEGFALAGTFSLTTLDRVAVASVDDEATVRAKELTVQGKQEAVSWSVGGGLSVGQGASVGLGVGVHEGTLSATGSIADNDTLAGRSSALNAAGLVVARDLDVLADTTGHLETIAIAGAVASNSDSSNGGFFSNLKDKYNDVMFSIAKVVDAKPTGTGKNAKQSKGTNTKYSFTLAGAGSAAVNLTDVQAMAKIENATIQQVKPVPADKPSLTVRAINDTDIVAASGAGALTRAKQSGSGNSVGVAGAVAVNVLSGGSQAIIRDSTVTGTDAVSVQALKAGENLALGIGLNVNAGSSTQSSWQATGSVSVTLSDTTSTTDDSGDTRNRVLATIEDSTVTGVAGDSARSVDVLAYNRTQLGTGAGSLAINGKNGVGGAVTYADVRHDTEASIRGSTLSEFDTVGVSTFNSMQIASAAAMGTATAAENANTISAAVVINEVTNNTRAHVADSSVTTTGGVSVRAFDVDKAASLDTLLEAPPPGVTRGDGYDYAASDVRDAAGTPGNASGNSIVAVAGNVTVAVGSGSNTAGAAINYNRIQNTLDAAVTGSSVTTSGGALNIQADSKANILGIAAGVAVSDNLAGAGSVTVNEIDNTVTARLESSPAAKTARATSIGITARDSSRLDTLAGAVSVSLKGSAGGAAATYNAIDNLVAARIDGPAVNATGTITLDSLNDSLLRSLAVAGAVGAGQSGVGFAGSIGLNFIANQTESTVKNAALDDPDGGGNTNTVTVKAEDKSEIQTLAGSVAVGVTAGAGGAFGFNKITNTNLASIEGSTLSRAGALDVTALETGKITAFAVAAGGGNDVAIAGSVTLNYIGEFGDGTPDEDGNVTVAQVKNSTVGGSATADMNVKAEDTSTIESLAGAVSVAISGVAVGAGVADNATRNVAKASVSGSTVSGFDTLLVQGKNDSTIKSLSAAGSVGNSAAFSGSASSNRTANKTIGEITGSDVTGGTAAVTVNSLDSAVIRSLAGSLAVGISAAGVGASVAVNRIANTSEARITGKRTATGLDVLTLGVKADSFATIETVAVAGGVGGAVGVAGSAAINIIDNVTDAHISDGAVVESDQNATVVAESDDRITVGAGAVGVGISAAGAGASVVVNQIGGATRAHISGPGTVVSARNLAGTPGVAVASGALNAAVNLLGGTDTDTYVRPDLVALRATETVTGVAVNASATHHVESYVANVGAGGVAGISGVANVNIIGGETSATIDSATINRNDSGQNAGAGSAQRVHVKASDHAYGNMFIGSVGAGGIVGVGVTADVAVFDRDTKATISNSSVTAKGAATIGAQSSQGMSTVVVGGAGGLVGVVGAGSVVKFTSDTEARAASSTLAVGSLDVKAKHDTDMFIVGGAVAVGAVGVGATFDVALDNSVTRAHVDDSTVTTSGQVNVDAQSSSEVHAWTVAGAGAGTVAAAGTASVILLGNTTQSWVSGSDIGTAGARAGGLSITATDAVIVEQKAGAGAGGGVAGAGVAAAITKVENTTSAYMDDSSAYVTGNVVVDAQSTRDMGAIVATAGGGVFAGIGGSVGVMLVGTALQNDQNGDTNANKELNKDGSGTLSDVNSFSNGNVIGSDNLSDSSENGYAGAGLSDSEIAAINNRARLDTGSRVYGSAAQSAVAESFDPATQLTGKTAAIIGGGSIVNANTDVKVHASEKDRMRMFAGAVAGGLAGIGGSVSVTEVTNNVEAAILGTTVTTANADLSGTGKVEVIAETGRLVSGEKALESKAYQAAGGAVALGAAVAVGNMTNNVKATIGRGTQTTVGSGAGGITVKASDTTDIDTEALGLQAGLVAAGGVIDRATKSGSVVARIGNLSAPSSGSADTFIDLASGTVSVEAQRSGAVNAKSLAGAGGIIAGTGSSAFASDTGTVQALVGNLVDVDSTGGAVNVNATATPQTSASSFGVNAGLLAVGASIAEATSSATVNATLGAGADVTGANVTVSANRLVAGGTRTASANATGASGGLVGVAATSATASSGGQVSAVVGDNATFTLSGAASISATNDSSQFADASGIAAGIVAAGSNVATATSNTSTTADVGDLVQATGASFSVSANGTDTNLAEAQSGSGGVVSGSAATANTGATSTTLATTGSGNATRQLAADSLTVSAKHATNFNGKVDSVNASVVGGSGAYANHGVNSTVDARIGDGGRVTANSVTVKAENISRKDWWGGAASGDAASWNILSGSGGVIDLPAGRSQSHVTHNTTARIGAGADIHVVMPALGEGVFALDALNEITGRDKAKLDSGGLIAVAQATAIFSVDSANATVSFGAGAKVMSDLGDIRAGARSDVDLDTRASADAYGLAGAPSGNAYSLYTGNNQAVVEAGAQLTADDGEVFIAGGQSSGGVATDIDARSTVNLWNKTAFPIATDPDAQSNVTSNAAVRILGDSQVHAAGDIALIADKGAIDATASGIGKDIYRETAGAIASGISNLFGGGDVSFDITGGSTFTGGLASLQVDGTVLTGIHRTESLTLDYQLLTTPTCSTPPCVVDGRVVWQLVPTATEGVSFTVDPAVGLAANIQARINKLRSLMAQYVGDPVAVASYQSEINFLMFKLVELGLASGTGPNGEVLTDPATGQPIINPGQWNNPSPRQAAQTQINQYQAQVSGSNSTVNTEGAAVRDTASSAATAVDSIVANASTVDANTGTLATTNTSIDTALKNLSGFSASHATYVQTNTLIGNNSTLRGEISTRRAANETDRATVESKRAEIAQRLTDLAGASDQSVINTKQAEIATRAAEIDTLLTTISTRNAEIKSRADQIVSNNATIAANQTTLANLWRNADGSEAGEVTSITNAINGGSALRTGISTARDGISTQQTAFSGYVTTVGSSKTAIDTAITSSTTAQTQIADLTAQLPTLSNVAANGPIADFVIVDDISVRLGNIRTQADVLTGSGKLLAPGDASITITNNTPNFLKVNNLSVLSEEGGTIRFNGVLVNSNADINRLNKTGGGAALSQVLTRDTQGAAAPSITIQSNYDPNSPLYANLPAPAPDIELNGDITNLRGSVTVRSKAGSIYSNGSINAGTVDVKADNGDFVQSFVDNFFHVGGDPASIQDHATPLGAGIVANGSVFLSARYLNINSLVQSGIEQWNLTLPVSPTLTGTAAHYGVSQATLDAALAAFKNSGGPRFVTVRTNSGGSLVYDALDNRLETTIGYADADRLAGDWATRTAGSSGLYSLIADEYGNIGSFYDPANQRYVIDGAQVRGGYIQLFGQVLNTSATAGAGKLKVLDGFGQINIQNPTSRPVVIGTLDTGADPTGTGRGVQGKIDIMDVQSINTSNGTSSVIHSVYTRDYDPSTGTSSVRLKKENGTLNADGSFTVTSTPVNGADVTATDGRHTSYTPQQGLRYVWTTGTDNSTITYWEYAGAQFFGSSDLRTAPTGTVVSKSGPHVLNSFRLDDGTYLSTDSALGHSGDFQSTSATRTSGDSLWVKTGEWSNCNWWTLCIAQDYHMTFTQTTPTKTITTKSKNADYPIAIEFSGYNTGTVTVNSSADVLLSGQVRNRSGDTSITSSGGIVQANDSALIASKNLSLTAGSSVGKALGGDPAKAVQVDVTGVLNASAANGNVLVRQTLGNLNVGSITAAGSALANNGRVLLSADGSILAANPATSLIQGHLVDLTSENGGIGSIASPLKVNVGYTGTLTQRGFYGLKAQAQGDIGIEAGTWSGNTAGDLLVNTVVSTGGDVKLVAPGRILDNNPTEQIDTRTWNELLNFWDSLALTEGANNDAKKAAAVNAFENGKNQDYRLYWLIRERQADPSAYDENFAYTASASERTALANSGMTDTQIQQFEANRTAQYHRLHGEVGGLTSAFDAGFEYHASTTERDALLKGSQWTERELGISISPGLLKNVTSTNPVIKSANAQGRNVTLQAGVALGETRAPVSIPTNIDPATLTPEQKVMLAAAERSDLTIAGGLITIQQRKPFNFEAPNGLSASVSPLATGHADAGKAFLASLGDGVLDTVSAPGEVRIKVRGSIVNETTATPAIQAGSLVLEAANGGIGLVPSDGVNPAVSRPVRTDIADGGTLIARAADNVDIVETAGDLNVDTVFSRKDASLTADGSILSAFPGTEMNVLADSITLTAQTGSIGSAANPLDVGVDPDGRVHASAATFGQGVYLNGPFTASFNIGTIVSGDAMHLSSDTDMTIDGTVLGPGALQIVAGGHVGMTANADVRSTTLGLLLDAGSLTMENGASLFIDVGTIDIKVDGDARITGIFTGNPTESAIKITAGGSVFDNGDSRMDIIADTPAAPGSGQTGAKLTIVAGGQIGGNPLDVQLLTLDADSAGLIHVNTDKAIGLGTLTAVGEIVLTSSAAITGGSASSSTSRVSLTSTGGEVDVDSVTAKTDVTVSGQDGVNVGTAKGENVTMTSAGGGISATSIEADRGVTLGALGDINLANGIAGTGFSADSSAGSVDVGTIRADTIVLAAATAVDAGLLKPTSSVTLQSASINATVDGNRPLQGSATGYGGGVADSIFLTLDTPSFHMSNLAATNATIDAEGDFRVDNALIVSLATISNPMTTVLIDQNDRTIRGSDTQLYSGGAPFALFITDNHVYTDAQVIYRAATHDAITPAGDNSSALEAGYKEMTLAATLPPQPAGSDAPQQPDAGVVSYSGIPVAVEGEPQGGAPCEERPELPGCKK